MKEEMIQKKENKKSLKKRLVLNKETIRELKNSELKVIAGGYPKQTGDACSEGPFCGG